MRCARKEDAFRKRVGLLCPYRIWGSHGGSAGGSPGGRKTRQDCYRKLRAGDATTYPHHYATPTKPIPLRGFLRFGIDRPPNYSGITEIQWGIIYRGSLFFGPRVELLHRSELREAPDVSDNVDALEDYIGRKFPASVFPRHPLSHMGRYAVEESTSRIEVYAR